MIVVTMVKPWSVDINFYPSCHGIVTLVAIVVTLVGGISPYIDPPR